MTPGEWACNLALYAIGVGIMPMGVVLTINAHLGAGGYDALNFALAERLRYQYISCHLCHRLSGGASGCFYQKGISETGDIYFVLFSGNIYGYVEDNSGACTGYRAGSLPAHYGGRRGGGCICSGLLYHQRIPHQSHR